MVENANRKAWVLASPEILAELQEGWSRPIQAHASPNADGSWDMTFRTAEGAERRVIIAAGVLVEAWDTPDERRGESSEEYALRRAVEEYDTALKAGHGG